MDKRKFAAALGRYMRTGRRSGPVVIGTPPAALIPDKLKTYAHVFVYPSGSPAGDWQPYGSLQWGGAVKGYGWNLYKDAIVAAGRGADITEDRSIKESAPGADDGFPTFKVQGLGLFYLLRNFDAVLLGHAPPAGLIRTFRQMGGQNVKVGLGMFDFESIACQEPYNPALKPIQDVSKNYLLESADEAVNNPGCKKIDQGEDNPYTGSSTCGGIMPYNDALGKKPHAWLVNTRAVGYVNEWATAISDFLRTRYRQGDVQFIMLDCVNDDWYEAAATNAAPDDPAGYQSKWRIAVQTLQSMVPYGIEVWVNRCSVAVSGTYTGATMPNRMHEFFFRAAESGSTATSKAFSPTDQFKIDFDNIKSYGGQSILLMPMFTPPDWQVDAAAWAANTFTYQSDRWMAQKNGVGFGATWDNILLHVKNAAVGDRIYVNNLRDGGPSTLFWQSCFKVPA